MEQTILYFDSAGIENTDATLQAARRRAQELGIRQIVVASTHGFTAKRAAAILSGLDVQITAVPISASFQDVGWTMTAAERQELEAMGIRVCMTLHALSGDVNEAFNAPVPNRIVCETLYRFCQGMKVAVEVAIMAAEAGLLDTSREAIAIAGTGEGADTAIVLKPACARKFKELEILEILAKPRRP